MIQYSLKCCDGHQFDSWFQSAAAFDKLQNANMVTCVTCGVSEVTKVLMTPAVRPARKGAPPAGPAEQMIADIREKVEANSEYVGNDFATQARAMHDGDAPEKAIYGEAKLDEARKLLEDGVPVLPLPFRPTGKDN
jgi:hypothetical protein